MVINLIGQSGVGKTTQSLLLQRYFKYEVVEDVVIIDGDELREIFTNTDYSTEGRYNNIQLGYNIAKFLHNKGYVVIIAMVSPFSILRDTLRDDIGKEYFEFYLHTSELRGRESYHYSDFQIPNGNHIDTTNKTPKETYEEILTLYREMANVA